jgi:hypothetical protein
MACVWCPGTEDLSHLLLCCLSPVWTCASACPRCVEGGLATILACSVETDIFRSPGPRETLGLAWESKGPKMLSIS